MSSKSIIEAILWEDISSSEKKKKFREIKKELERQIDIDIEEVELKYDRRINRVRGYGDTQAKKKKDASSKRADLKADKKEAVLSLNKNLLHVSNLIGEAISQIAEVNATIEARKKDFIRNKATSWAYLLATMASLDGTIDGSELNTLEQLLRKSKEGQRQIDSKDFDESVDRGVNLFQELKQSSPDKDSVGSTSLILQEAVRQMTTLRDTCSIEQTSELTSFFIEVASSDGDVHKKETTFIWFSALFFYDDIKRLKSFYKKLNEGFSDHEYNLSESIRLLGLIKETRIDIESIKNELVSLRKVTFKDFGLDTSPEDSGFKEIITRKAWVIRLALIIIPLGVYYYIKRKNSRKTDIKYWRNLDYLEHLGQKEKREVEYQKNIKLVEDIISRYSARCDKLQSKIESFRKESRENMLVDDFPNPEAIPDEFVYDRWLFLELLSYAPGVI